MGGLLDKPMVEKDTDRGEGRLGDGAQFSYGASGMCVRLPAAAIPLQVALLAMCVQPPCVTRCACRQGYRPEMEDQHTCATNIQGLEGHAFFAVYDGHGGERAGILAEQAVLPAIQRTSSFKAYVRGDCRDPQLLAKAMEEGFLLCDKEMRPKLPLEEDKSGATATTVFITPTHIICANAGDSRSVYCRGNVVALSEDHKPDNPGERRRIEAAGGHIAQGMMGAGPMRVDGDLALSRALGDFTYKQANHLPDIEQKVSPQPECVICERDAAKDELIILACDGIWDVMTNQECCDEVRSWLANGEKDMGLCAEELLDTCLDKGSKDNMSAIVIAMPAAKYGAGPGVAPRRSTRDARRAAEGDEDMPAAGAAGRGRRR